MCLVLIILLSENKYKMFKKSVILLLAISLFSCNSSKRDLDKNEVKEVAPIKEIYNATEFDSLINNNSDAVLIDVRTPAEFSKGHLENALNLDWKGTEFDKQLEAVDKNKTVLIYCLSGGRSSQAAAVLREKGFTNVLELEGGIMSWRNSNLPEVSKKSSEGGMSLNDFEKLLDTDKLVLVDFNAVWCAPCKKMKPFIDKIEKDYSDKVKVVKIDVDENAGLAKELKVVGLPVVKIYKNNEIVWEHVGFVDEQTLISQIK